MRQIVHLKLSAEFPPEVREAAVVREEDGKCTALLKLSGEQGCFDLILPFAPCADLDPTVLADSSGARRLAGRFGDPAYQRLMDALRQTFRSME